jgi:anthranilate synthase component 2
MFILIDNYDSFTYNLYHFLGELGATLRVYRNDQISVDEVMAAAPQGIILSPGPCTPNEAGICLDLVKAAAGKIPLFGVCLGHQTIGQVYGGDVVRAPAPMHGKLSTIAHSGAELFEGIDEPFEATRYHSLIVERATFPAALEVTAETNDGIVMGLRHRQLPLWGVQFHPESIASQHGHRILANFLRLAGHNADAPMLRKSA